jgi:glucose-6-phosphate 1-dehydrogenase
MNNLIIVIFGASGDLAKRKLIPALYHLLVAQKIGNFAIVGAAYDQISKQEILTQARHFISDVDADTWHTLSERMEYQALNFTEKNDYYVLHDTVTALEKKYNLSGKRLAYLASAAHFFCPITNFVVESGIIGRKDEKDATWHRIVYEKPFGSNLDTAHHINECIATNLNEHQVFRIDHFLTKELVSNISLVRFANCVFEPLWNNRYIEEVQITLSEQGGIEKRGAYYDQYGALADVVQNHMLELLALIAMETPERLNGDYVRMQRAQVLQKVQCVGGILGQYEGYLQEHGIAPHSTTETFAMLSFAINNPRWDGVPFYFKTGKELARQETVINIKFKQVDCLLLRNCPTESNWLSISITPDAAFTLNLNLKRPGTTDDIVSVPMEFCHSCVFGEQTPEAYEVLLEEIFRGEQSASVRFDEIEYGWRIVDDIKKRQLPLYRYVRGSDGPIEIQQFEETYGMRWRE